MKNVQINYIYIGVTLLKSLLQEKGDNISHRTFMNSLLMDTMKLTCDQPGISEKHRDSTLCEDTEINCENMAFSPITGPLIN